MTPRGLMIMGGIGGGVLFGIFLITPFASATVAVFAFGAIFGKGYGLWEERRQPHD